MTSDLRPAAPSKAVRAEAAVWVARLHCSDCSHAVESDFRKWLAADPAHSKAFEMAIEAWELGGIAHLSKRHRYRNLLLRICNLPTSLL